MFFKKQRDEFGDQISNLEDKILIITDNIASLQKQINQLTKSTADLEKKVKKLVAQINSQASE